MGTIAAVSACLVGVPCAYDGNSRLNPEIFKLLERQKATILLCPELIAGLKVPRARAEIIGGDGMVVIAKKARVINEAGRDTTRAYLKGAKEALELCKKADVKIAYLRERSPSCGVEKIYDGSFKGKTVHGCGVFTALLKTEGIETIGIEVPREDK